MRIQQKQHKHVGKEANLLLNFINRPSVDWLS